MAKRRSITNNMRSRAVRTTLVRPRSVVRSSIRRTPIRSQFMMPKASYPLMSPVRRTQRVSKFRYSTVVSPIRSNRVSNKFASFSTSPTVRQKINHCVSRAVRRRVLASLKIIGRKGLAGGRWSASSYISCRS